MVVCYDICTTTWDQWKAFNESPAGSQTQVPTIQIINSMAK